MPTRNPYRKGNRGKGATWTPPAERYHSLLEDEPVNSAKRDGGKPNVGSFGAQGLHHARHPVESRKKGEGTDLTPFVFDQTGWAQVHITAKSLS